MAHSLPSLDASENLSPAAKIGIRAASFLLPLGVAPWLLTRFIESDPYLQVTNGESFASLETVPLGALTGAAYGALIGHLLTRAVSHCERSNYMRVSTVLLETCMPLKKQWHRYAVYMLTGVMLTVGGIVLLCFLEWKGLALLGWRPMPGKQL
jgi:hypothetical protein